MTPPSGYEYLDLLHTGPRHQVYRARQISDGLPVVLKIPAQADLPRAARLRAEYDRLRGLSLPGVIQAHSLAQEAGRWFLVLEDFGGLSLDRQPLAGHLDVSAFLELALALSEALAQLHQRRLFHARINPSHLLLNPHTGQVKLAGLAQSRPWCSQLPAEGRDARLASPEAQPKGDENGFHWEGLPYIAPEQTGRMQWDVDFYTDFYSLGVCLYQLITGRLPLETGPLPTSPSATLQGDARAEPAEALAWLHTHLAVPPVSPCEFRPELPSQLGKVLLKLLVKTPEARYRSVDSLQADLRACAGQWHKTGRILPFPLAVEELPARLQWPERLYGRNRELRALRACLAQARQGQSELILISGQAGVGKSGLVQYFAAEPLPGEVLFASGKFRQYQWNTPYAAIIESFACLTGFLLRQSEARLAQWREALARALGTEAWLLCEIAPRLETVLGPRPPSARGCAGLAEAERQACFHQLILRFLQVFAQPAQPLILFLDDLHWADPASLELLRFLGDSECGHLLLIGAYRDDLEAANPPPPELVEGGAVEGAAGAAALQELAGQFHRRLLLDPLSLLEINRLLADTLGRRLEETQTLAALLHAKTEGNPLFLKEFVNMLQGEGLIRPAQRPAGSASQPVWEWDIARIRAHRLSDSVSLLMSGKLDKLSAQAGEALGLAACFGNAFELRLLAEVWDRPLRDTLNALGEAVALGLILAPPAGSGQLYRFAHDRIEQAVYARLNEADKKHHHRRIGEALWRRGSLLEQEEWLFDIVNHLNLGQEAGDLPSHDQAELNLRAGRRAKAANAPGRALAYFERGLAALALPAGFLGQAQEPQQSVREPAAALQGAQYALCLALYGEAAEAAYLSADFAKAERLADTVIALRDNPAQPWELIAAHEIKIRAQTALGRPEQAVNTALAALARLGFHFPPGRWQMRWAWLKTAWRLAGQSERALLAAPDMRDPRLLAAMRLLGEASAASASAMPALTPLLVLRMVELSARHGHTGLSAVAYSGYAAVLARLDRPEAAWRYGQLAGKLLDASAGSAHRASAGSTHRSPEAVRWRARTRVTLAACVAHWRAPLAETLAPLLTAATEGMRDGDLKYAAQALWSHGLHLYLLARPLPEVAGEVAAHGRRMAEWKQNSTLALNRLFQQYLLNLLARVEAPACLRGEAYDETALRCAEPVEAMAAPTGHAQDERCLLWVLKAALAYTFENPALTRECLDRAEPGLDSLSGSVVNVLFHFYRALSCLAGTEALSARRLRLGQASLRKLRGWARCAPFNYRAKYLLVQAESQRRRGLPAQSTYAAALEAAPDNSPDRALAYELLARYHQFRGETGQARVFIAGAWTAYLKWGARGKAEQLETRYRDWLERPETPGSHALLGRLDLETAWKAHQAFAGEIELSALLRRLLEIALQNAGAEYGFLLLPQTPEVWWVAAGGRLSGNALYMLEAADLEAVNLPKSLIRYVRRTAEPVVLADACRRGDYTQDPYIAAHQCQSVLCLPLRGQGQTVAILYLENTLAQGVFTPQRLRILEMLSSQMAGALLNARLYADTKSLNLKLQAEIEEHSRAAKALAESEERFRVIAETIPVPATITRQCDGQILYVNNVLAELRGLPAESLVGRDVREFYSDPAQRAPLLETLQREGHVRNHEMAMQLGREKRWAALFMQLIHYNGEAAILTVAYDITERKQAEAERARFTETLERKVAERTEQLAEQTEAAIRANQAKSRLISAASHDLRQPLYAAELYLNVLARALAGQPEPLEIVGKARRSLESMNKLFESMLHFARLESGTLTPELRGFELQPLFDALENDFAAQAREKKLAFSITPSPATVYSDPILLEQILRNLLSNAIRYTERGAICLDSRLTAQAVEIVVRDTGIGIPKPQQQEIFGEFHQLPSPSPERRKGVGLGLSIVRRLSELLAYPLELESAPGQGTLFRFRVPLLE